MLFRSRKFTRQGIACLFHTRISVDISIKDDVDGSSFPLNAVKVRNWAFHVLPTARRPRRLADRPAPVPDAGNADGQKARLVSRNAMKCQRVETDFLFFAL